MDAYFTKTPAPGSAAASPSPSTSLASLGLSISPPPPQASIITPSPSSSSSSLGLAPLFIPAPAIIGSIAPSPVSSAGLSSLQIVPSPNPIILQEHVVRGRPRAPSPSRRTSDPDAIGSDSCSPMADAAQARVVMSKKIIVQARNSVVQKEVDLRELIAARKPVWMEQTPMAMQEVSPAAAPSVSSPHSVHIPQAHHGAARRSRPSRSPAAPPPSSASSSCSSSSPVAPSSASPSADPAVTSARLVSRDILESVGEDFTWYPEGHAYWDLSSIEIDTVPLPSNLKDITNVLTRCVAILKAESNVLRVPVQQDRNVRIFGDIHGQIHDLCSYFYRFGSPAVEGDEHKYVFLGDFVDRGGCSLHVMLLLCSFKILYPTRVFLVRGNHEDLSMSDENEFGTELRLRFASFPAATLETVRALFADVFDYMPLAAVVGESLFCLHGGLGPSLQTISQLEAVERPCRNPRPDFYAETGGNEVACTALWSDPHTSSSNLRASSGRDKDYPTGANMRYMSKYGSADVRDFCARNGVEVIVRAHEWPQDGIDLFAGARCITVFSATQYCGSHQNAGAQLEVSLQENGQLVIQPKLMVAVPPEQFVFAGGR